MNIQYVDNNPVNFNPNWKSVTHFKSINQTVEYQGKQWRIIQKWEEQYSPTNYSLRYLLGVALVICSLFTLYHSKSVRKLFSQKNSIRIAVPHNVESKPAYQFKGVSKVAVDQTHDRLSQFYLMKTAKGDRILPVKQNLSNYWNGSFIFQDSPERILYQKGISNSYYSFNAVLNHPNNHLVEPQSLLRFLLQPDGQSGTPRIAQLGKKPLQEALEWILKLKMAVDLKQRGENDLSLWEELSGKGRGEITSLLLKIDPSCIEQTGRLIPAILNYSIYSSALKEFEILLNALKQANISLTKEEEWYRLAFENNDSFVKQDFQCLTELQKKQLYFAANAFGSDKFVQKLNSLEMSPTPHYTLGPRILANNMDFVTAQVKMFTFLKELRNHGNLLSHQEFQQFDPQHWYHKRAQFDRLFGHRYLERLIQQHHLVHIKVPRKIVVLQQGLQTIHVSFVMDTAEIKDQQMELYARKITPVKRMLCLAEALELMKILVVSGFADCGRLNNIIIAASGIYIIDTEQRNFLPREVRWDVIENLIPTLLKKSARRKYYKAVRKAKRRFEKRQLPAINAQYAVHYPRSNLQQLHFAWGPHGFHFPVASLLNN